MKRISIILILVLSAVGMAAQRSSRLMNFGWKFFMGDVSGAEVVGFDDSSWRTLDIPHDFQMEEPWEESAGRARGFKAMGVGWYRLHFAADPEWQGKKVLLDFEGLMAYGDIWLNGRHLGEKDHSSIVYGYLGAEFDVSGMLRYDGEDNVVAVRATTGKANGSRWYTGGGLFRDVHIVVKDSFISISRHGVYITTDVRDGNADVNVQVDIDGMQRKRIDGVRIETDITDAGGRKVASTGADVPRYIKLPYTTVRCPAARISDPELWDTESPYLYTAEVRIYKNDTLLDRVTEQFGIRTIEYTRDQGLLLNGRKVFLKGIANHHDLGALGAAAFEDGIERLFKTLKSFGYNHIRTSHNPYSAAFLRMADKYGILITDELFDKWGTADWVAGEPFQDVWHKALPEWVKRDRNHPSVILWSLGNELQMGENYYGYQTNDWGVTTYRIMDVMLKRYDSTRPSTVAMFPSRANAVRHEPEWEDNFTPPELSEVTEIASYNYQYPAYQGYLKHNPNLIIYQSEATTNDLLSPYYGMDRDKMVGLAYWGAVEYWGESNAWPKKGWNYSFFRHTLEPNPQAYLIKSAFDDTPIIYIGVEDDKEEMDWNDNLVGTTFVSSHWNRAEGSRQKVYAYTNADEAELFVGGKSLGVRKNERADISKVNRMVWEDVPYEAGYIEAVARTDGKTVATHRLETAGKAVALKAACENDRWKAGGMGLEYIKVYAVDEKGRKVPYVKDEVKFEVSGEATIYAIDNGDHFTSELFNVNPKKMHQGFVMAILRSTQKAGNVTVRVTSPNMKSTVLKLKTY